MSAASLTRPVGDAGEPATVASWLDRTWVPAAAVASFASVLAFSVILAVHSAQVDITVYLFGGRHVLASDLYALHTPGTGLLFTYPPFAALAFAPLAQVPALAARIVWAAVDAGALAGLLFVSLRTVRPAWPTGRIWRGALLCTAPAAVLNPVFVNFQLGQVNLVLALMVTADLLRPPATAGKPAGLVSRLPEGLLTGVAAAVKLTPLILVPYLLLVGKRRAVAWAAGTFAGCELLAVAFSPVASWRYWTKAVFQSGRAGNLTYISNQNLRSILDRFHHGAVPGAVVWPLVAVLLVAGLALAAAAYRRCSPLLGLLVCVTTGLCVSPITWVHHLVWVVPAVFWMAMAADRPAGGRIAAAATLVLFWAGPVWWVPNNSHHEWHESAWQLAAGNSFFFAMAIFLAGSTVLVLRRGPGQEPVPGPGRSRGRGRGRGRGRLARTPSLP